MPPRIDPRWTSGIVNLRGETFFSKTFSFCGEKSARWDIVFGNVFILSTAHGSNYRPVFSRVSIALTWVVDCACPVLPSRILPGFYRPHMACGLRMSRITVPYSPGFLSPPQETKVKYSGFYVQRRERWFLH